MKLRILNKRTQALTFIEALVVIAIAALLMATFDIGVTPRAKERAQRINCLSNLRQIDLAQRTWEGDVETNHSVAPWSHVTSAVDWFRSLSNQLGTPKILICPADRIHPLAATNFQNDFNSSHISYFISPNADETYPQMIMSGDDNLAVKGVPVKSGIVSTALPLSWTASRHINVGNIGFADGSVAEVSNLGLRQALILGTNGTPGINQLAIP